MTQISDLKFEDFELLFEFFFLPYNLFKLMSADIFLDLASVVRLQFMSLSIIFSVFVLQLFIQSIRCIRVYDKLLNGSVILVFQANKLMNWIHEDWCCPDLFGRASSFLVRHR